MRILWRYLKPQRAWIALALLLAAASQVLALVEARRQIGIVTQQTLLFAGTLRENLLFVNADASDDEMIAALEQAACAYLLEKTGEGLDTRIGEMGVRLSGGERQRVASASAWRSPARCCAIRDC